MDLLIVGTIGFDTVETPAGKSPDGLGGTATFCSLSASFFTNAGIVACVGTDFSDDDFNLFKKNKVNLDGLSVIEGKTFAWGAKYHQNMNMRETLYTHLNVFESFTPNLPAAHKKTPYVFLANIDPNLQMHVLEQVENPEVVALDTMNYWIEGTPDALKMALTKARVLLVNDEEAEQLTGEKNILRAAQEIAKMGPEIVIIKKGEHGALMINDDEYFYAPAFPLDKVVDPTGAGDTFAGGFMGYLAMSKKVNKDILRRAMIYGSTMASFAVEDFSVNRLKTLTKNDIQVRFNAFHNLTAFEQE